MTQKEAEKLLRDWTNADITIRQLEARKEKRIALVEQSFADSLKNCEVKKTECLDRLEQFAKENPGLFLGSRSYTLSTGTIGYSLNPPAVRIIDLPLDAKASEIKKLESKIAEDMLGYRSLRPFVNIAYSIDKAGLKKEKDNKAIYELLGNVGLDIDQRESFYVKPL
jgi:hypothetical protein